MKLCEVSLAQKPHFIAMFLSLNPTYLLFIALPLFALSTLAYLYLKTTYARYAQIPSQRGVTGAAAARSILDAAGLHNVRVESVSGWLSDHYSPSEETLRLSPDNYSGTSIAALGVAAHEAGHALQHAQKYAPLVLHSVAIPVASIGSNLGYVLILLGAGITGFRAPINTISLIGLALFALTAIVQLINLPVEFDASRRALQILPGAGILSREETQGARSVLTAAALTYVAATVGAIAHVLYLAWQLGLLGGSRESREE